LATGGMYILKFVRPRFNGAFNSETLNLCV